MTTVKLTAVGDDTGIVLPSEILERLQVSCGDELAVRITTDGIELTPHAAAPAQAIEIADRIMDQRRDLLKRLAE